MGWGALYVIFYMYIIIDKINIQGNENGFCHKISIVNCDIIEYEYLLPVINLMIIDI